MSGVAETRISRRIRWRLGSKQATHGIYDEIVVLAVILALEGRETSGLAIMAAVYGALVAVVLAELYADYIGTMIGTGRRPTGSEVRYALATAATGLLATAPPVFLLVLGVLGVMRLETSFTAAKWAGAAVLTFYAVYASRRAGLSLGRSLVAAGLFAAVGFGLVALKHYFH